MKIATLQDVVDWDLCTGCGACAYACKHGAIRMENIEAAGLRPRIDAAVCDGREALAICPGAKVDARHAADGDLLHEAEFGPVLEIWEGHAADPELRFRASSGGVLTALALYCLEQEGMSSVLHAARNGHPWLNETVQSRSRADLLARTGSRYAPASPCDGLARIAQEPGQSVFIGKPCDAAAVAALRRSDPQLQAKLGLVMSFFCAGTPSTRGTLELAARNGIAREEIGNVQYRGDGWPGNFRVYANDGRERASIPYHAAWGALTAYRPLRCNLCPDGIGRTADISCGDAWEKIPAGEPGLSLILVRTGHGRELLHHAAKANYITLLPAGARELLDAQPSLLDRRRQLFGRLLALRLLGIPIPHYLGFSLFTSWRHLPALMQFKTIAGTLRRALQRAWWKRRKIAFDTPAPAERRG